MQKAVVFSHQENAAVSCRDESLSLVQRRLPDGLRIQARLRVVRRAAQSSGLRDRDGELPPPALALHTGGWRSVEAAAQLPPQAPAGPRRTPKSRLQTGLECESVQSTFSEDVSPSRRLPAGSTMEISAPTVFTKAARAGRPSDRGLMSDFRVRAGICLTLQASTNPAPSGLWRSAHPDRTAWSCKGPRQLPGRAGDRTPAPWRSAG